VTVNSRRIMCWRRRTDRGAAAQRARALGCRLRWRRKGPFCSMVARPSPCGVSAGSPYFVRRRGSAGPPVRSTTAVCPWRLAGRHVCGGHARTRHDEVVSSAGRLQRFHGQAGASPRFLTQSPVAPWADVGRLPSPRTAPRGRSAPYSPGRRARGLVTWLGGRPAVGRAHQPLATLRRPTNSPSPLVHGDL